MDTDTVDDLSKLKVHPVSHLNLQSLTDTATIIHQAIAGERQARDSANNPQIPDDKVPKGSAASKT